MIARYLQNFAQNKHNFFMNNIEDIINDLKKGKMVILVDDEDRENEGDLLLAADHVTPEFINFMAKYGRGLICLTLTEDKAKKLKASING